MTNPIENNFNLANFSIEKLSNEYFPNLLQQDLLQFSSTPTLIETHNEQYHPSQIKKKESRTKKHSKMEGKRIKRKNSNKSLSMFDLIRLYSNNK